MQSERNTKVTTENTDRDTNQAQGHGFKVHTSA